MWRQEPPVDLHDEEDNEDVEGDGYDDEDVPHVEPAQTGFFSSFGAPAPASSGFASSAFGSSAFGGPVGGFGAATSMFSNSGGPAGGFGSLISQSGSRYGAIMHSAHVKSNLDVGPSTRRPVLQHLSSLPYDDPDAPPLPLGERIYSSIAPLAASNKEGIYEVEIAGEFGDTAELEVFFVAAPPPPSGSDAPRANEGPDLARKRAEADSGYSALASFSLYVPPPTPVETDDVEDIDNATTTAASATPTPRHQQRRFPVPAGPVMSRGVEHGFLNTVKTTYQAGVLLDKAVRITMQRYVLEDTPESDLEPGARPAVRVAISDADTHIVAPSNLGVMQEKNVRPFSPGQLVLVSLNVGIFDLLQSGSLVEAVVVEHNADAKMVRVSIPVLTWDDDNNNDNDDNDDNNDNNNNNNDDDDDAFARTHSIELTNTTSSVTPNTPSATDNTLSASSVSEAPTSSGAPETAALVDTSNSTSSVTATAPTLSTATEALLAKIKPKKTKMQSHYELLLEEQYVRAAYNSMDDIQEAFVPCNDPSSIKLVDGYRLLLKRQQALSMLFPEHYDENISRNVYVWDSCVPAPRDPMASRGDLLGVHTDSGVISCTSDQLFPIRTPLAPNILGFGVPVFVEQSNGTFLPNTLTDVRLPTMTSEEWQVQEKLRLKLEKAERERNRARRRRRRTRGPRVPDFSSSEQPSSSGEGESTNVSASTDPFAEATAASGVPLSHAPTFGSARSNTSDIALPTTPSTFLPPLPDLSIDSVTPVGASGSSTDATAGQSSDEPPTANDDGETPTAAPAATPRAQFGLDDDVEVISGMFVEALNMQLDTFPLCPARVTRSLPDDPDRNVTIRFLAGPPGTLECVLSLNDDVLHPVGWGQMNDVQLEGPPGWAGWAHCMRVNGGSAVPARHFTHAVNTGYVAPATFDFVPQIDPLVTPGAATGFGDNNSESGDDDNSELDYVDRDFHHSVQVGMRLEALDRLNPTLTCVATIADVNPSGDVLIHFDGWTERYDYWASLNSDDLHPVGYCQLHNISLQRPRGHTWTGWRAYLQMYEQLPVPTELLTSPTNSGFVRPEPLDAPDADTNAGPSMFSTMPAISSASQGLLHNPSLHLVQIAPTQSPSPFGGTINPADLWVPVSKLLLDPSQQQHEVFNRYLGSTHATCVTTSYLPLSKRGGPASTKRSAAPDIQANSPFVCSFMIDRTARTICASVDGRKPFAQVTLPDDVEIPEHIDVVIGGQQVRVTSVDDHGSRIRTPVVVWSTALSLNDPLTTFARTFDPKTRASQRARIVAAVEDASSMAEQVRKARDNVAHAALHGKPYDSLASAYRALVIEHNGKLASLDQALAAFRDVVGDLPTQSDALCKQMTALLEDQPNLIRVLAERRFGSSKALAARWFKKHSVLECVAAFNAAVDASRAFPHWLEMLSSATRWSDSAALLAEQTHYRQFLDAAATTVLHANRLVGRLARSHCVSRDTRLFKGAQRFLRSLYSEFCDSETSTDGVASASRLASLYYNGVSARVRDAQVDVIKVRAQRDLAVLHSSNRTSLGVLESHEKVLGEAVQQLATLEELLQTLPQPMQQNATDTIIAELHLDLFSTGVLVHRSYAADYSLLRELSLGPINRVLCVQRGASFRTAMEAGNEEAAVVEMPELMGNAHAIALKVVPLADDLARELFVREVMTRAEMRDHPGVVPLQAVFFDEVEGKLHGFLEMPLYVCTLETWAERRAAKSPAKPWELRRMLSLLLQTVVHLHERGFVHRDLQPSNVLIAPGDRPVLTGFSVSKNLGPRNSVTRRTLKRGESTRDRRQFGFAAPESEEGQTALQAAADLWGFGAIALWLHTNELPSIAVTSGDDEGRIALPTTRSGRLEQMLSRVLRVRSDLRATAAQLLSDEYFCASYAQDLVDDRKVVTAEAKIAIAAVRIKDIPKLPRVMRAIERELGVRVQATGGFFNQPNQVPQVSVTVARAELVKQTLSTFASVRGVQLLGQLHVRFDNEIGIDQGGLSADLFACFFAQSFDYFFTSHGLPHKVHDLDGSESGAGLSTTAGDSVANLIEYETYGRVMAKSVLDHFEVNLRCSPLLFKFLVHESRDDPLRSWLTLADVEKLEGARQEQMRWMLTQGPDVEGPYGAWGEWGLTYSANKSKTKKMSGGNKTAVNGEEEAEGEQEQEQGEEEEEEEEEEETVECAVTETNKLDYIARYVNERLILPILPELNAIQTGFYSCPGMKEVFHDLSVEEAILLVCGERNLTPELILDNVRFINWPEESKTPALFRTLMRSWAGDERRLRQFLQLCTGRDSMAAGALAETNQAIRIQRTTTTTHLPVGHTCSHLLDLPDYNDADLLKEKMELALESIAGSGFHLA